MIFWERCSPDSLESLGGDSLLRSQAKKPAAPPITLDLVKEVTMPGGARNHMNVKLRKCLIAKMWQMDHKATISNLKRQGVLSSMFALIGWVHTCSSIVYISEL